MYRDYTKHSGIKFQCRKCEKGLYREELFKGTHLVCTWNILVDLQKMKIQEEHPRIYKQSYSLDTWRQVAPMWDVSWHAYFESSHGNSHLLIHGMENQLNTKSLHKYLLWVWKYQYHQSGSWQTHDVTH